MALVKRYLPFPACADGDAGSPIRFSAGRVGTGCPPPAGAGAAVLPQPPARRKRGLFAWTRLQTAVGARSQRDNPEPRATARHKHAFYAVVLLSSSDTASKAEFGLSDLLWWY